MAAGDWSKGLAKGFFWGGLIGIGLGILFTSKRDKGTWEDIGKSADALVDKTKEQVAQAQRKMEALANRRQDSDAGETEGLKEARAPQG